MFKLTIFLLSVLSINGLMVDTNMTMDDNYVTCSVLGVTHMRGFTQMNTIESCQQLGTKILFDSPWMKVISYTYMNDTTMNVDWMSTKIMIEFFGDIYGIPIGVFSTDVLLCNCTSNCMINNEIRSMGVDNVIDYIIRRDGDSVVAYLNYKRANMTLYIRKTTQGFNFGLRVPRLYSLGASGMCVTLCPKPNEHNDVKCLQEKYLQTSINICKAVLKDLETLYKGNEQMRLMPCSHDIFIWRNASLAVHHRHALVDDLLIMDFSKIITRYNETLDYTFDWTNYDGDVETMIRSCMQDVMPDMMMMDTSRLNVVDLSNTDMSLNDTIVMDTIKVDLTKDRFMQLSLNDDSMLMSKPKTTVGRELPEWDIKCRSQRMKKLGVFYLRYTEATMYVTCNELNQAYLNQCPMGTWFTLKMVCEEMPTMRGPVMPTMTESVMPTMTGSVMPTMTGKVMPTMTGSVMSTMDMTKLNDKQSKSNMIMMDEKITNPCNDATRLQKVYFFPHPFDVTKYIQCDDFNNMSIGQCLNGTKYSMSLRTCQKL